ncbi:zinc metalloprotease [Capsulimonas corticalis]|uniref:Zinc metalloprotease n=1 Tax=Capsulimonas corticalis TaxID=2219043 RepID=A0A402D125_9BACT|nr:RIP metalloprotease [Capsulimonas corticalis]BDI31741.1 zinc metalloprotease [Capsulimonas corticalis]
MNFHFPSFQAIFENLQHVIVLLIILSILVVAHEWGHFIVARMCGMRVDDFSVGMGKRIWRVAKRGNTEYNVRMLPIGGFVKIAGMDADEEPINVAKEKLLGRKDDPDAAEIPLVAENTPELEPYNEADGFNAKPLWMRSLTILAGPVMSFILGYAIFCLMGWTVGVSAGKTLNRVAVVMPGGEGFKAGLLTGDTIVKIDDKPITNGAEMVDTIRHSLNKPIAITVLRNGQEKLLHATPQPLYDDDTHKPMTVVDVINPGGLAAFGVTAGDELRAIIPDSDKEASDALQTPAEALDALKKYAGQKSKIYVVRKGDVKPLPAVLPAATPDTTPTFSIRTPGGLKFGMDAEVKHLSFVNSIKFGNEMIVLLFKNLGMLIKSHKFHEQTGGVIRMYQETSRASKVNINEEVSLAAQLSISLALFNLLPIPILDGGHLLTFFIEWVRRGKKLTERQQQAFMLTGLVIIGTLFILINANDILRTIHHQLPQ